MINSQLPIDRWHEIIGDPTYADAIFDRLVHNANRIELAGESKARKVDRPTSPMPEINVLEGPLQPGDLKSESWATWGRNKRAN